MTISRKTKISIITLVTVALAAFLTSNSEAAVKATSTTKPSIASSTNGGSANRAAEFKKYSDCLTSHGGTAPQFRGGPGSNGGAQPSTSAAQQAAVTACKALAPKFGGRGMGFNRQLTPAQQKAMTAYVACLKGKGLAVKTSADLRTLNRADAKVQAAMTACQSKSPFQYGKRTSNG